MADPEYMRHAIRLAEEMMRGGRGGPFGAVIVTDGQVIAEGYNKVTSDNDPTAHAEVVAIREACAKLGTFSLQGSEIFTSCEPCPMCLSAVYWARLDRIYYANTRDDAAKVGFDDGQCLVHGNRPLLDPLSQRRAFDQLQDQRLLTLRFFQPVDGADVGMVQ